MIPVLIAGIENLRLTSVRSSTSSPVYTSSNVSLDDVKVLYDAISCTITEERNGIYELQMTYNINGENFSSINVESFILAKPNDSDSTQPFRVYKISTSLDGKVIVYAEHASYIMNDIAVLNFQKMGYAHTSASDAMAFMIGLAYGTNYSTGGDDPIMPNPIPVDDIDDVYASDVYRQESWGAWWPPVIPSALRKVLLGQQGSILQYFGGEYKYDWFKVSLLQNRGSNNGVTLTYGRNIKNVTQTIDISNTYSGVLPYWHGYVNQSDAEETTVYLAYPNCVVYTSNHEYFDHEKVICVDFSDKIDVAPTASQLRSMANSYISENKLGEPDVTVNVSFLPSWQADEGDDELKQFEHISLCDIVTIVIPKFGINAEAKVVKTVYDCLRERYDTISIGTIRKSFAGTIGDAIDAIEGDTLRKVAVNSDEIGALKSYSDDESINLNGSNFIGYLTNSKTRIQFSIPLQKGYTKVTSATISGNFVIRHADGGYIGVLGGQTLQSLGTVTVTMSGMSVWVRVDLSTALTITNNVPIVVQGLSGSKLTFLND